MTKLIEKTKAVRKTFTIPNYIVNDLENYAQEHNLKQSQIVADALEEYVNKHVKSTKVQKRIEALSNLIGIAPKGSLTNVDMKDIQAMRARKHAH
ncbi:MAG: hypothetical protein IE909_06985 [Campylobacterales bacterium]|nr:hypothetical protein [Campylobacterales bacterium]